MASLIVKSEVKQNAKSDDKRLMVSEEFYDALDEKVKELVEKACKRAKANSRNTVMARDL
ncbi:MAG TPA: DUF1931 domain-containing protein [Candidatus Nanoarchaeia archaeon]|nr:DUF1931 domain-containing protein [Candidatus Nanoarchaeia archaeon]